MDSGTRIRMRDVGGGFITGTVSGPGEPGEVRPLDSAGDEDIPAVVVEWDDEFRGTETVAVEGLEVINDDEEADEND